MGSDILLLEGLIFPMDKYMYVLLTNKGIKKYYNVLASTFQFKSL